MPCSRGLDRAKLVSGHSQYTVLPSLSILPTKRKISLCLESTKTKVVQSSEIPKNHSSRQYVTLVSKQTGEEKRGTVCNDYFNMQATRLFCQNMGYPVEEGDFGSSYKYVPE